MTKAKTKTEPVPDARTYLGIKPVDLYFPCETCDHPHERHEALAGACKVNPVVLTWKRTESGDGIEPETEGPCPCEEFAGLLEDGKPKAIRLRMPSNGEWSTASPGRSSMPVDHPDADQAPRRATPPEEKNSWARAIARMAVTHFRHVVDGKEQWASMRLVETAEEAVGPGDIWVEDFDKFGTGLVAAIVARLRLEYNEGGPFGGVVRNFRARGAGDVRGDGEGVRSDAPARDEKQPQVTAG